MMQHTLRRRTLSLAAALCLVGLPMTTHAEDTAQQVMDVTQQACEAFRAGDVKAAERLLAPTFTLVGTDATVQSRESVLAEVRSRDPQYEVFRNHSMTAQVHGSAAIVQGITSIKGSSGGKSFEVDVRFTDTLIKQKGRWLILVSHVTRIPASR